jgi:hypothetical protein
MKLTLRLLPSASTRVKIYLPRDSTIDIYLSRVILI